MQHSEILHTQYETYLDVISTLKLVRDNTNYEWIDKLVAHFEYKAQQCFPTAIIVTDNVIDKDTIEKLKASFNGRSIVIEDIKNESKRYMHRM